MSFRFPRKFGFLLLGLALPGALYAADSANVSLERCFRAFQGYSDLKESAFESIRIPAKVELPSLSKDDARYDFNLGLLWFRSSWNDATIGELRAIAARARDAGLSPARADAAQARLKQVRSTLKFLRFLFNALERDHDSPKAFDELATAIGKLRDGIRRLPAAQWPELAQSVLDATAPRQLQKIEVGIADFRPVKRKDFDAWLASTDRWTLKTLGKGSGTAADWHQARKNLQALLSVYEVEQQRAPDPRTEAAVRFLIKQTELMGDEVGEHEEAVLGAGLDYEHDVVPYPAAIVRSIVAFFNRAQ